jgi:hypothetical protein
VGFEAQLFNSRMNVQVNYYDRATRDLLISAPVARSVGAVAAQFRNLGRIENRGVEFQVGGTLFQSRPLAIEATLGGNTLRNRLTALGAGIAPIVAGAQQHRSGYPAGGFWQRQYTFADSNSDRLISRNEVRVAATAADTAVYLGNPLPKLELQFNPAIRLFERVRLQALISHRGGFKVFNNTNRFRCAFAQSCQDINDPSTPLDLQARAVAAIFRQTDAGYIEDATFTRLREVSATISLPQQLARRARFQDMSLVLAGRNLATWTNYTGLDPEVATNPASFGGWLYQDFLTVPPVRFFTARLNLTF